MKRLLLMAILALVLAAAKTQPAGTASEFSQNREKWVVLTFDDSVASHATFVAPLLKKHGFGATFFITEGFEFLEDKTHYMTWDQIRGLHEAGFEIGNHTRRHTAVPRQTPDQLRADILHIEQRCQQHGIPKPTSFCYPGYQTNKTALQVLESLGYHLARAGGQRSYVPGEDHPLLLPQAFDGKPDSTLESFKEAVAGARKGAIPILTFHGVPDIRHPWVNTDPTQFEAYMNHLKEQGFRGISLREMRRILGESSEQQ